MAAAATLGFGVEPLAAQSAAQPQLQSELLMTFDLQLAGPEGRHDVGYLGATMSTVQVTGGSFEGPKLRGRFVAPGGDWLVRRSDGSIVFDLRVTLQTDDNANILMTYRGVSYTPKGGTSYNRITPVFQTSAEKYVWLNNIISVGVRRPDVLGYRVYQIL